MARPTTSACRQALHLRSGGSSSLPLCLCNISTVSACYSSTEKVGKLARSLLKTLLFTADGAISSWQRESGTV